MATKRSVLLLGATGLVGTEVLRRLEYDQRYTLSVLARRPPDRIVAAKVRWTIGSLFDLRPHEQMFDVDAVICAVGTTRRKVGSESEFRRIDHDIPLEAAEIARERGTPHFILVSSVGADPHSRIFYSRVKGETEEAIAALGFASLSILRPSLLLGDRKEFRAGEELARLISPLAPARWKGVAVESVAATIAEEVMNPPRGARIIESQAIRTRRPLSPAV